LSLGSDKPGGPPTGRRHDAYGANWLVPATQPTGAPSPNTVVIGDPKGAGASATLEFGPDTTSRIPSPKSSFRPFFK